jgi:hypothetical protein
MAAANKNWMWWLAIGGLCMITMPCCVCNLLVQSLLKRTPEQKAIADAENEVYSKLQWCERKAKELVVDHLKAPKSAEFELIKRDEGGLIFTIDGKVHAQNSFGALIATPVTVVYARENLIGFPDLMVIVIGEYGKELHGGVAKVKQIRDDHAKK